MLFHVAATQILAFDKYSIMYTSRIDIRCLAFVIILSVLLRRIHSPFAENSWTTCQADDQIPVFGVDELFQYKLSASKLHPINDPLRLRYVNAVSADSVGGDQ